LQNPQDAALGRQLAIHRGSVVKRDSVHGSVAEGDADEAKEASVAKLVLEAVASAQRKTVPGLSLDVSAENASTPRQKIKQAYQKHRGRTDPSANRSRRAGKPGRLSGFGEQSFSPHGESSDRSFDGSFFQPSTTAGDGSHTVSRVSFGGSMEFGGSSMEFRDSLGEESVQTPLRTPQAPRRLGTAPSNSGRRLSRSGGRIRQPPTPRISHSAEGGRGSRFL
jgi:hypothetical protein